MASPDPTDAYTNNAMDTAQAAAAGVNVSDFNALQQAAAGGDHTDAADPANASSTAAAALVYPTIHAPQPSEENFAAQVTGDEGDQHNMDLVPYTHDASQPDGLPMDHQALANVATVHNPPDASLRQIDDIPGARYSTTPNPKPAVGSEEWHKMRKDNHKEGEFLCNRLPASQPASHLDMLCTDIAQWNDVGERLSMKASTSLRR